MRRYWIKIFLGAFLIFGVGFTLYAAGRGMVHRVDSDQDITIPFGSLLPFTVGGERMGSIRSLTIRRSAPKVVTGFAVRVRLTDSAKLSRLEACRMAVNDPEKIDLESQFQCIASDSGYEAFGEIRLELRNGGSSRTEVHSLFLPAHFIQQLRREASDTGSGSSSDSLAREIRERVRVQTRYLSDSVRAASLEERALKMQQQADSIRTARKRPPPPP